MFQDEGALLERKSPADATSANSLHRLLYVNVLSIDVFHQTFHPFPVFNIKVITRKDLQLKSSCPPIGSEEESADLDDNYLPQPPSQSVCLPFLSYRWRADSGGAACKLWIDTKLIIDLSQLAWGWGRISGLITYRFRNLKLKAMPTVCL